MKKFLDFLETILGVRMFSLFLYKHPKLYSASVIVGWMLFVLGIMYVQRNYTDILYYSILLYYIILSWPSVMLSDRYILNKLRDDKPAEDHLTIIDKYISCTSALSTCYLLTSVFLYYAFPQSVYIIISIISVLVVVYFLVGIIRIFKRK